MLSESAPARRGSSRGRTPVWEVRAGGWSAEGDPFGPVGTEGGMAVTGDGTARDVVLRATLVAGTGSRRAGLLWGFEPAESVRRPYHRSRFPSLYFLAFVDFARAEVAVARCREDGTLSMVATAPVDLARRGGSDGRRRVRLAVLTDQPAIVVQVDGRSVLSCQPHPLFQQTGRIGLWADAPCGFSAFTVRPVRRWTLCSRPRLDGRPQPRPRYPVQDGRRDLLVVRTAGGRMRRIVEAGQWEEKRRQLLENLRWLIGDDPTCDLPLRPRHLGAIEMPEYRRQEIALASTPGNDLTLYLLTPRPCDEPAPAVIVLHPSCGPLGKKCSVHEGCYKSHRQFAEDLALRGYVTVAPDDAGFGGRPERGETEPLPGTSYWSAYAQVAYDVRRIVDWLSTLPQVDPRRIGVMGHSRGGWMAAVASAFEPRLAAVVVSGALAGRAEYGPKMRARYAGYAAREGLFRYDYRRCPVDDHEMLALTAPRPLLKVSGLEDWHVPIGGCTAVMEEVAQVYRLLGQAGRVRHATPAFVHGLDPHGLAAAYDWFDRWLRDRPLADEDGLRRLAAELARQQDIPAVELRLARLAGRPAVSAADFTGGLPGAPEAQRRYDSWTERDIVVPAAAAGLVPRVTGRFTLTAPPGPLELVLRCLSDTRVRLRILLNGRRIFEETGTWTLPEVRKTPCPVPPVPLRPEWLRTGANELVVENLTPAADAAGNPQLLLFYAFGRPVEAAS